MTSFQVKITNYEWIDADSVEEAVRKVQNNSLEYGIHDFVEPHYPDKYQLKTYISANSLDKLECALDWVDIDEHPELIALFDEVRAIVGAAK